MLLLQMHKKKDGEGQDHEGHRRHQHQHSQQRPRFDAGDDMSFSTRDVLKRDFSFGSKDCTTKVAQNPERQGEGLSPVSQKATDAVEKIASSALRLLVPPCFS